MKRIEKVSSIFQEIKSILNQILKIISYDMNIFINLWLLCCIFFKVLNMLQKSDQNQILNKYF